MFIVHLRIHGSDGGGGFNNSPMKHFFGQDFFLFDFDFAGWLVGSFCGHVLVVVPAFLACQRGKSYPYPVSGEADSIFFFEEEQSAESPTPSATFFVKASTASKPASNILF